MDKNILRRLGWSEELIDAMSAASVDAAERSDVGEVMSSLDVADLEIGATAIDLSDAPIIASPTLQVSRRR